MAEQQFKEIDRSLYDFKDDESEGFYRMQEGLTADIVERISEEKHDPEWMREFRLKCLDLYNELEVPNWGPSIEGLDMDRISSYVRSHSDMKGDWSEVPDEIKNTFEKLSADQQQIVSDAAKASADYDRELNEQQTNDLVSALEEKGMKINSPELAPFAAATEKVLTDNADTYGDLLDQLKAWKEAR